MTSSAYLNSIKSGAIAGWHTHKIAPSITGAQAALESGWGTSSLAKPPYNNNFGIKASGEWTGRTVTMPTREYVGGRYITVNASFRAYDSIADSVRDHGAFFTNTEWRKENYKHVVGERDYKKSARALQNAGYATDPSYATKLINIIEQYQLYKWDTEAYSGVSQPTESTRPVINPQPQSKVVGKDLSNAGREYVKTASISVIGDSLGVGTKPYLEQLIPKSNYDVVGSRQITHTKASLNATTALRNMLNAGTLKNIVIVIIGTNRGVTQREVEDFADIAGSSRKLLFVDTASQVNHAPEVSRVYKNVASARSNVFYVNWRDYALSSREAWYYADGAGGTYIHMNPTGYRRHAEYIAQAIYEADNSSFSQPGDVAIDTKTYYAHVGNLELGPDGIIEYEATSIDGKKKTFKKDLGVKGFYSPKGDMAIYNPEANEKWNNKHNDEFNANWIEAYFEESEVGLDVTLLERAVRYLDEHREPSAQYRIQLADIPQTLSIGDTGVFIDHDYNPPLYIEARVLELTTSRTNPSQNTVLIGNVVELQPQAKSWVHTMQQGLQQMREDFYGDWINREPVNIHVEALNTLTLTENESSTYLSVKVMRGNIDVTEYYDNFSWERTTSDEESDEAYNQILSETERTSVLHVTKNDLRNYEATFSVRVYDNAGTMVGSSVVNVTESVEGKSAFEIWKETENLPNATLEDYVEFQRGQKGEPGADGQPGKDGIGITDTVVTYVQTDSEIIPPDTADWSDQVSTLVKGNYLWTKTVWTYTDGTNETGYSVSYIAEDGNDGGNGLPGKDGVGITDTIISYAESTSGVNAPTGGYTPQVPDVPEGHFLWTKTEWIYTDGTNEFGYSVSKIGEKGEKGDPGESGKDGLPGKDGTGIKTTDIAYAQSTSGTVAPTSGWSDQVSTLVKGQYLWTRSIWTYTDNSTETGYSVSYIAKDGNTGDDGQPGKDGVGITATAIAYARSTNGVNPPSSGFSSTIPSVPQGQFLWTRTIWTYSDKTTETGYSVAKMGEKGDPGAKGEPGDKGAPGKPGADGKDGENANSINLLLNGDNGFSTTSYQVAEYTLTEDFVSGETYTLIIKGSKKSTQNFGLWQNGASTGRGNLTEIGGGMYQITFTSGATTSGYHRKFRIYQPSSATAGQANIEWATLVKGAIGLQKFVKSPEQLQGEIDNKASNSALDGVSNQVGGLTESQKQMQENMEAYLKQQEVYNQWLKTVEGDAKNANELAEKVNNAQVDIQTELNDQAQKWVTQEGFIQFDGETNTISIASESKNTQMIIDDEALGFYSGGTRVAAITNQYLQIDRGIFTKSAQMGNHKFEPLTSNPDHFILSYVKGGNQ